MAKRIDEETKLRINELYYEIGVKSQVAKILSISPASVSRYIIEGWTPPSERNIVHFEGTPNPSTFISTLLTAKNPQHQLWAARLLTEEEWIELIELQKEEII